MVEAEFEAIWAQIQEDREQRPPRPGRRRQGRGDPQVRVSGDRRTARAPRSAALGGRSRINGIDVTQEELNRALSEEARRHPGQEREVFEYFKKTPEALANLRAPIYEDKVIDFITALAKVSERKMSIEELTAEVEGESGKSTKKPAKKAAAKKAPAKKAEDGDQDKGKKAAKKGAE